MTSRDASSAARAAVAAGPPEPVTLDVANMSFDAGTLFLSLITGGIGLVLFVYGKKQERWPQLAAGIALMVYPYFVSDLLVSVFIGIGIVAGLWLAVRQGW
jgi:hypothetical protein